MLRRLAATALSARAASSGDKPVRIGVVGTGGRGTGLIRIASKIPGVAFPALCDINAQNLARAQDVVMSAGDPDLTAEQIAATGVKRISVGGALSRLALAAFMKGANDMKAGSFLWMRDTMATSDLKKVFRG